MMVLVGTAGMQSRQQCQNVSVAPAQATRRKTTCNTVGTTRLHAGVSYFRQWANLHTRMYGKPSTATHAADPEQAIMIEVGACPLSEQFQAMHEHDSVA